MLSAPPPSMPALPSECWPWGQVGHGGRARAGWRAKKKEPFFLQVRPFPAFPAWPGLAAAPRGGDARGETLGARKAAGDRGLPA